jgi:hypothetical protein
MQTEIFPVRKAPVHINLNIALRDIPPWKRAQFYAWHKSNPNVWVEVEHLFVEKVKSNQKRIGLKEIFEELRQTYKGKGGLGDWKLNNNWTAIYGSFKIVWLLQKRNVCN